MLVVSSGFANKPADLHSAASGNIASKPSVPSKNKHVNYTSAKIRLLVPPLECPVVPNFPLDLG